MSNQVEFVHQCDVPPLVKGGAPKRYPGGAIEDEANLPADWLKGAKEHEFVREYTPPAEPTPAAEESEAGGADAEQAGGDLAPAAAAPDAAAPTAEE